MLLDDLKILLEKAIENLFTKQTDIFSFTSETGQTEWNLAHHLANEISSLLPSYDCDLDVTKRNFKNRRPDIIIHKRNTHAHNFTVIEIKKDGSMAQLDYDIDKIKDDWFSHPLSYRFGAVINLGSSGTGQVQVFQNGSNI